MDPAFHFPVELLETWDDFRHINLNGGILIFHFSFSLQLLIDLSGGGAILLQYEK